MTRRDIVWNLARAGALALALAGFTGAANAQQPPAARVELAREIVIASGATRSFEPIVPGILQQAIALFVQQNPDLQKQLLESAQAIKPEFDKRLPEVIGIVARVYAGRFSDAELKEILAFYRSPVGKKYVATLPGVLEESLRLTQAWGNKISEEIVVRMRAEMKRRGHDI
jgi:hypothetical protein